MKTRFASLCALTLLLAAPVSAQTKSPVVSRGTRFDVKKALTDEGATVLLFVQDTSVMEDKFVTDLEKQMASAGKVGIALVRLKDTAAPVAQQYHITATPTAVVYDRFGKEIGRCSQPDEILVAVRKGTQMGRIKWIDEDDPLAEKVYGAPAQAIKAGIPGIVKTMSLRPEAFRMFNMMSSIHFSDGFLRRREHEMIAAYVSSLNKCKF